MDNSCELSLLYICSDTNIVDIINIVNSIKWTGRKGSAARSITVELLDDDDRPNIRVDVNIMDGRRCMLLENDEELFRGIITKTSQSDDKILTFTAYDMGIYLSNNKDTFVYEDKTANNIFIDICNRLGLPMGGVAACTYRIPELSKSKTSAFDAISDAMSLEFENTGIRHYVCSIKGEMYFLTRLENVVQWVIEPGQNLIEYDYDVSIDDTKTRIKILSDEDTVAAEASNSELESKIGIFTDIDTADETLTDAQITELAQTMLAQKSTPERSLKVEALGISDVIAGVAVYIIIPHLNISGTFYVDEDTHTFDAAGNHTMTLTLNYANVEDYED